jgi:hypothetical protein
MVICVILFGEAHTLRSLCALISQKGPLQLEGKGTKQQASTSIYNLIQQGSGELHILTARCVANRDVYCNIMFIYKASSPYCLKVSILRDVHEVTKHVFCPTFISGYNCMLSHHMAM